MRAVLICLLTMPLLTESTLSQEVVAPKTIPTISKIDTAMQRFVDEGQISGAVTLVGHKGKIVHLSAVGLADTLIRISPGVEDERDLVEDLLEGLDALRADQAAEPAAV